jgi:hypothetical protein
LSGHYALQSLFAVLPIGEHTIQEFVEGGPVVWLGDVAKLVGNDVVTLRERRQDGVASLLVGSICALCVGSFVNPLISPLIGDLAPNGDSNGFASFIVGISGIFIAGLLIDLIRTRTSKAKGDSDAQG